ncbi:Rab family GTPase [Croceiramulus getboli]|nr:GTP-binding protein [Flavobacteriaceae bacterium YJPT1-3]
MSVSKKVVLAGHFGVGKSSLMRRFVEDSFSEDYKVTIGVHIMKKPVQVEQETIHLIIWDIEGTDDIRKYRPSYLLGASGFIYVFDLSRTITYANLDSDLNYINEKFPGVPVQVVGNKLDLVDSQTAVHQLQAQQVPYNYLTSAKTGDQVSAMFRNLAAELLRHA